MTRLQRARLTRDHAGLAVRPTAASAACPGSTAVGEDEEISDVAWSVADSSWAKAHEVMASLLMDGQPGGVW